MSINKYIAERLTELYTEAKELPRSKDIGYKSAFLTYIFYNTSDNSFYFGGNVVITEQNTFFYDAVNIIPYHTAVKKVWNYLDNEKRVELMASVLGQHAT